MKHDRFISRIDGAATKFWDYVTVIAIAAIIVYSLWTCFVK
jgi:hypothetical protein